MSISLSSPANSASTQSTPTLSSPEILFTTDLFDVRKSPKGGWGAFAIRDVERGTVVFSELPLFRTKIGNIYHEYENLTREQRAEYRTLAHWYKVNPTKVMGVFLTNR